MKSIFAFFLIIITSFGLGYGQCDVDSNSEKHDLEDLEISQRMDMTFYSDSDFESGYILKATDGKNVPVIYHGGIWIGGIDANNSLRVSAKQYLDFENYQPGLLNDDSGLVDEITCENWNQGFTVKRANIDDHIFDYEADGQINESTSDDIMFYPAIGNPHFYPNPFTDELKIVSDQDFDKVNIYNIQGQLVKRIQFLATKKKPLDTSALSSGIYYMTILSNSATLGSTQKIVKF